jgi:tripartite-type tricarboxylate transporter receptor subunit TctC
VITTTPQLPINPVVRQTQYKVSDLAFVANVVNDPGILVVRTESPYKTLADFIKGAKDNPGKVGVGVSSAPGDDWFAAQMMQEIGKVKLNVVPFAGDGPSWQAALGGHVDSSANNLSIVYSQVKAGKLRALAIMTEKRSPFLPDVPTFKELGYDIISGSARGFAMPKNTPKAAVDTFANTVKQVMNSEEFKANAEKTAFPAEFMSPEQHTAFIQKLDTIYRPLWEKYGHTATAPK